MQPHCQLLPHLTQIVPHRLCLHSIPRRLERLIQREARLTRYAELLERAVDQRLLGALRIHAGFDLGEAVGDEEDAVNQQPIGGAFDLEVAEEGICAEEAKDLVESIVGLGVRVHVEGGYVGGEGGEGEGGAAGFGSQGKEGDVSWQALTVMILVGVKGNTNYLHSLVTQEDRVVGLGCVSFKGTAQVEEVIGGLPAF